MDKLIFCNLDLLKKNLSNIDFPDFNFNNFDFDKLEKFRNKFLKRFKNLSEDTDNKIIFYSRDAKKIKNAKEKYDKLGCSEFEYRLRETVETFINKNKNRNHHFVVIGGKNKDFELAVNSHSLYIVPTWLPLEEKSEQYGIHVDTVTQLCKFILTLNNQNAWYSELEVDDITTCVS